MLVEQSNMLKPWLQAIYNRQIAVVTYYSCTHTAAPRTVEPYAIINLNGATMLKAYQLSPEPAGWRIFNADLIGEIRLTDTPFSPRRPFTLESGGEVKHIAPAESSDQEQSEYERILRSAIVDLRVRPEELQQLVKFRAKYGLSADEVRGVHYRVFSDCLAAVTHDRIVTKEERQMLIDLNNCLRDCGAGLIQ